MASKRTVLITGCSDGSLGSALALALQQQGWRVLASARNESKLKAAKDAGLECVLMDVSSEESIASAVEHVRKLTGGSLDALVNNAGAGYSSPAIHLETERMQQLFDLNVFSITRVTSAFLPLLLKSSSSSGSALVANNTSGAGLLGCGLPFQGGYAASKAAAASITESLRIELAPFGIRVVNLVTGGVKSTFYDNAALPKLPAGSVYDVAREAVERSMAGEMEGMHPTDVDVWARQVAGDLSKPKPPFLVFRGASAGLARVAALLPTGSLDGTLKKAGNVHVLEQKIKEKGGLDKIGIL